jgi:hypothetical protein
MLHALPFRYPFLLKFKTLVAVLFSPICRSFPDIGETYSNVCISTFRLYVKDMSN